MLSVTFVFDPEPGWMNSLWDDMTPEDKEHAKSAWKSAEAEETEETKDNSNDNTVKADKEVVDHIIRVCMKEFMGLGF